MWFTVIVGQEHLHHVLQFLHVDEKPQIALRVTQRTLDGGRIAAQIARQLMSEVPRHQVEKAFDMGTVVWLAWSADVSPAADSLRQTLDGVGSEVRFRVITTKPVPAGVLELWHPLRRKAATLSDC